MIPLAQSYSISSAVEVLRSTAASINSSGNSTPDIAQAVQSGAFIRGNTDPAKAIQAILAEMQVDKAQKAIFGGFAVSESAASAYVAENDHESNVAGANGVSIFYVTSGTETQTTSSSILH